MSKTEMRRILLVDDEPDVAITIEAVLEECRFFQIDPFHDRPGVYDLALLEIKMPRMNGFELCKKLRGIDNKIIVCFLTADDLG
jgi:two-component system copper resistance phosphate regulon response regulator CusR